MMACVLQKNPAWWSEGEKAHAHRHTHKHTHMSVSHTHLLHGEGLVQWRARKEDKNLMTVILNTKKMKDHWQENHV